MIRIVLIALTIVLSPAAWAQPFNQFVGGLPSANPLGGADLLYVVQGGISKNVTAAALAASFPSLSLANPTASIGLVPINGSASTAMRSDAAPAINTAIIPTWSGLHTFGAGLLAPGTVSGGGDVSNGATGAWNDRTSITGTLNLTLASFYSPFYYGTAGTGIVDRMNRVFIGTPAASIANGGTSNDILSSTGLPTSPGWLDTLVGVPVVGVSQLAVGSTFGGLAITGYCRTSDYEAAFGTASQGCEGGTFFTYNNDTMGGALGVASYNFAARASGVAGVTAATQIDINNKGSVVDLTPTGTITGGVNIGSLITSGAFASLSNANATAAVVISAGRTSGPTFRKGILFMSTCCDTSIGLGGNGIAMDLYQGQSIRWLNASNVSVAEMWGNSGGGLIMNGTLVSLGGVIIDTAAPTAGAGEIGYGGTITAAGTGTCPATMNTSVSATQAVAGCIVVNIAGTNKNAPFF